MKLATFRDAAGQNRLGAVSNDVLVGLRSAFEHLGASLMDGGLSAGFLSDAVGFLQEGRQAINLASDLAEAAKKSKDKSVVPLAQIKLLAPIPRPPKIVAVGRNYKEHAAEGSIKLPELPKLFPKFPNTVIGPNEPIVLPKMSQQVDFEVELAVVIGRPCTSVSREEALQYVGGYTILNDVSARDIQFKDEQITLGKNFATFCPMGPYVVTADEIPDPGTLDIRCWVNDKLMQDSNTKHLIFDVPYLVSFISTVLPLEPGDVIATGTPAGVGVFRKPPVFLRAGDRVRMEVQGVGVLENPVV